jgi:hypothetical protein
MDATAVSAFPAVLDVEPFDELSAYVARELGAGRKLFDVLGDPFVLERADEYLSVLDHLARDPLVRAALAGDPCGGHVYALPA